MEIWIVTIKIKRNFHIFFTITKIFLTFFSLFGSIPCTTKISFELLWNTFHKCRHQVSWVCHTSRLTHLHQSSEREENNEKKKLNAKQIDCIRIQLCLWLYLFERARVCAMTDKWIFILFFAIFAQIEKSKYFTFFERKTKTIHEKKDDIWSSAFGVWREAICTITNSYAHDCRWQLVDYQAKVWTLFFRIRRSKKNKYQEKTRKIHIRNLPIVFANEWNGERVWFMR